MSQQDVRVIENKDFRWKYDISEFKSMTRYFTSKDWKKAKVNALRKVANQLKRETVKTFKRLLPASAKKGEKYSDKMTDAIKLSKFKYKRGDSTVMSTRLHVIDTRQPSSGTFRAHFFEDGTDYTKTKHSYTDSLGRKYKAGQKRKGVKGLHYFAQANSNTQVYANDINKTLSEQIIKINNKKNR